MQGLVGVTPRRVATSRFIARPHVRAAAIPVALLAVALALFAARAAATWNSAPVTSDESLYLSEAVSISHGHVTYSSGDPIIHRPPLYPATLAPVMQLSGNDLAVARVVPALYALGALLALFLLGCALFDPMTAAVATLLAAAAAYPAQLSVAFFVDTPAAMWALGAVAALVYGMRADRRTARWCGLAGVLLGLSFLTKETAVFLLPLPTLIALFDREAWRRMRWSGIACWCGGALICIAPWFVWTAVQTRTIYKLPQAAVIELAVAACAVAIVGLLAWARLRGRIRITERAARGIGALVLAASIAVGLRVLELRPEPQPIDYAHTVPSWLLHVYGSSIEPAPLIALAWLYLLWRACRGHPGARVIALFAALQLPVLVFVANRDWEPRQVMPLVYLSYLALAWALVDAGRHVTARWSAPEQWMAAAATIAGLACIAGFVSQLHTGQAADPGSAGILDWNGPAERAASRLLDGVPPGSVVLSSRLFYSQLYVDHDGGMTIRQLPTLGVRITSGARPIRPFGTLFRYEDATADLTAPRNWISLHEYATHDYAIGISEEDLLSSISDHHADFVLISGDDAGFSSLTYLSYFEENPAFRLVDATGGPDVRSYLFAVDRTRLAPEHAPLDLDMRDFAYIGSVDDGAAGNAAWWRLVAPNGVRLDGGAIIDASSAALLTRALRADRTLDPSP
jgi:4-amino-4-deoxy-L-arabinose transferase-like glycosyltransferase